jgi:ATP-dependent protease ClpP protease subunit
MPEIVTIDGVIGVDVLAKDVKIQLAKAKGKDVTIELSSPGGDAFEMLTIFNYIKNHKGKTETKINGLAASAASYIALASDRVIAESNAVFMIHNARGFAFGDQNDLRKRAATFENISNQVAKAYVKKTGKTKEEIQVMMDEETFFFGDEIKEAGFADLMIESEEKEEKGDAVALAKMSLEDCRAKIKDLDKADDLDQIAALLNTEPAAKKTTPKGAPKMTPEEIVAMQKENERLTSELEAAKVEPAPKVEEPKKDPAPLALASQVLRSAEYPEAVKAKAEEFIKGEVTEENFKMAVSMADMIKEQLKSAEAVDESATIQDTPGVQNEPTGLDKEGNATNAKGIYALGENLKIELAKKNGEV